MHGAHVHWICFGVIGGFQWPLPVCLHLLREIMQKKWINSKSKSKMQPMDFIAQSNATNTMDTYWCKQATIIPNPTALSWPEKEVGQETPQLLGGASLASSDDESSHMFHTSPGLGCLQHHGMGSLPTTPWWRQMDSSRNYYTQQPGNGNVTSLASRCPLRHRCSEYAHSGTMSEDSTSQLLELHAAVEECGDEAASHRVMSTEDANRNCLLHLTCFPTMEQWPCERRQALFPGMEGNSLLATGADIGRRCPNHNGSREQPAVPSSTAWSTDVSETVQLAQHTVSKLNSHPPNTPLCTPDKGMCPALVWDDDVQDLYDVSRAVQTSKKRAMSRQRFEPTDWNSCSSHVKQGSSSTSKLETFASPLVFCSGEHTPGNPSLSYSKVDCTRAHVQTHQCSCETGNTTPQTELESFCPGLLDTLLQCYALQEFR